MTSHVQDFDLKKPHKVEPMLRCLFQVLCGDPKTKSPTKWSLCFDADSKYFAGTPKHINANTLLLALRLKRIHSKILKSRPCSGGLLLQL